MSSGQFNLGGMDGVDGLQAIHPSQLSIGNNGNDRLLSVSQSMDLVSMQSGSYNMSGMSSPVQNNNTMTSLTSSQYISSIMSDPCNIFAGSNMEYGVIGTSDQPDTKDGLEELCPVCGDKVTILERQLHSSETYILHYRSLATTMDSSHASLAKDSSREQFRTRKYILVSLTETVSSTKPREKDVHTADSKNALMLE